MKKIFLQEKWFYLKIWTSTPTWIISYYFQILFFFLFFHFCFDVLMYLLEFFSFFSVFFHLPIIPFFLTLHNYFLIILMIICFCIRTSSASLFVLIIIEKKNIFFFYLMSLNVCEKIWWNVEFSQTFFVTGFGLKKK